MPTHSSLAQAVERMTTAAVRAGRLALVLPVDEWQALVLKYMLRGKASDFLMEVIERYGAAHDTKELDLWAGLALNIWNNTPQPDRGGKAARELSRRPKPRPSSTNYH